MIYDEISRTITITKATNSITLSSTENITVTYGEEFALPTATSVFGEVSCSHTLAELVNAGEYVVVWTVEETTNYAGATAQITVTIVNASITVTVTANELTYTGSAQSLVTGEASVGTIEYSLDQDSWSSEVPTGTNAGEYTVYYRVVVENYDTVEDSVTVTIKQAANSITLSLTENITNDIGEEFNGIITKVYQNGMFVETDGMITGKIAFENMLDDYYYYVAVFTHENRENEDFVYEVLYLWEDYDGVPGSKIFFPIKDEKDCYEYFPEYYKGFLDAKENGVSKSFCNGGKA